MKSEFEQHAEKDEEIAEKDELIAKKDAEISELKRKLKRNSVDGAKKMRK